MCCDDFEDIEARNSLFAIYRRFCSIPACNTSNSKENLSELGLLSIVSSYFWSVSTFRSSVKDSPPGVFDIQRWNQQL